MPKKLIDDGRLFPRSEYYTRFEGTTAFEMTNPDFWGTYHRSMSTRFSAKVGQKEAKFTSDCATKPESNANSFHAHTGSILSPFSNEYYQKVIALAEQVSEYKINVRDKLLLYKRRMAEVVLSSFENEAKQNSQKIKQGRGKNYITRPIVNYENDYPCILVSLPVLNPAEAKTKSATYWAKHPKPFQRLLLASFISILNVEAKKANIPIEMVIRASFGHNLPSICETDNTFRINVGVIPESYAKLIGKALVQLNQIFNDLTDESTLETPFDKKFLTKVRHYNVNKLKIAIQRKDCYKKLISTTEYKNAEKSDKSFEKLYEKFCEINKEKKSLKAKNRLTTKKESSGKAKFIPVRLEGKTIWEVIREAGDSIGKSVLAECFRENESVDWFANIIIDNMFKGKKPSVAIENALFKLLKCLDYGDKATMDYAQMREDLQKSKHKFGSLSFKSFYEKDKSFDEITKILFKAFCAERPDEAIYSGLEYAGAEFFKKYRGSKEIPEEPDNGSASEFSAEISEVSNYESSEEDSEAEISEDEESNESDLESKSANNDESESEKSNDEVEKTIATFHVSHSKIRVCSGMKAIMLAQFGALAYLRENGAKKYKNDVEQMYYEVENALRMVTDHAPVKNKVRAGINDSILHYDLNHCNAANADNNIGLSKKLHLTTPSVVVLDYTSSTLPEIREALQICFSRSEVKSVIMVDSGLKNNQGGEDFNPYGEVRVLARDRKARDLMVARIEKGLSEDDKLSPQTHEMVRACKKRGLAVSFFGLFKPKLEKIKAEKKVEAKLSKKATR